MPRNPPIPRLLLLEKLLGLHQQKEPKRAAPIRLLALRWVRPVRPIGQSGLTGPSDQSDRSAPAV